MGGFMVNGTGTSDKLIPIKSLGTHPCPHCNSIQEFNLSEVKRKIKVLYIPTVTISTKYAVTCTRCKNGVYIGEDVMNGLLNDRLALLIDGEKVYFGEIINDSQEESTEEPAQVEETPQEDVAHYCSKCGNKIEAGQNFCPKCGAKLEDQ